MMGTMITAHKKRRQLQAICNRFHRDHQELAHQGDARHGDAHDGTSLSELQACTGSLSVPQRTDSGKVEGLPDKSEDGKNCVAGLGDMGQIVSYYLLITALRRQTGKVLA